MANLQRDIWSQWLLNRRFGNDPQRMKTMLDYLHPVRDKVLSHVDLEGNDILLDVGCGDGLIAFGALEKFKTCQVIFSDISDDLLQHVQTLAHEMNVQSRCQFIRAPADNLAMLDDKSVAAVTTRSVLIYVSAKQQAFDEFYRVLKPQGCLSIFEPINRFTYPEPPHIFIGCDVTPVIELAQKVKAVYRNVQSDTDPMLNFDERDLIIFAEKAGFSEVYLDFYVEIKPRKKADWETVIRSAGNPKIPTVEEAINQALTPAEAEIFINHLRPLIETGQGISKKSAVTYLWAVK